MSKKTKSSIIFALIFAIGFVASLGGLYYTYFNPTNKEYKTTIMIDPGHGGYDVGAVAVDGTYEKDINLEIALSIGQMIERMDSSIRVMYTRSDDKAFAQDEVSDLQARVDFATKAKADYFLSIHCNASQNMDASGYSFYVKNTDAVSDRIARKASENLKTFKWSSSQGIEYTLDSSLYVVDNLEIPSMLFEMGFITNPNECAKLQKWYNKKFISYSIAKSYVDYVHKFQR